MCFLSKLSCEHRSIWSHVRLNVLLDLAASFTLVPSKLKSAIYFICLHTFSNIESCQTLPVYASTFNLTTVFKNPLFVALKGNNVLKSLIFWISFTRAELIYLTQVSVKSCVMTGCFFLPLFLKQLKLSHISATFYTTVRLAGLKMSSFLFRERCTVELT